MKFEDNNEIIEFLGKAQSKIGELGTYIASRKHDKSSADLCKELTYVIKAFVSPYNNWSLGTALDIVNYYNVKAELNNVPYLNVVGYDIKSIKIVQGGGSNISSVYDIEDYAVETNKLITNSTHNNLKGLQGGKKTEYYHVDKKMYDWIMSQVYPFIPPVVTLSISPSTTVYEKGTSIGSVTLSGGYTLNSGKSVVSAKYYKGDDLLATNSPDTATNNFIDNSVVSSDTTYKYKVEFEEGGSKEASKTIKFVASYYSYLANGTTPVVDLKNSDLTNNNKVTGVKPSQINQAFTLASGNATATNPNYPRLLIPKSYGLIVKILVDNNPSFDYISDWEVSTIDITLADNTKEEYYVYKFKEATEGTFNFNFKWQ
jgi:hypothetical protein